MLTTTNGAVDNVSDKSKILRNPVIGGRELPQSDGTASMRRRLMPSTAINPPIDGPKSGNTLAFFDRREPSGGQDAC